MKIGINASFARKSNTGIGQVTLNFLKKLGEFPVSSFYFPDKSRTSNAKTLKQQFFIYLEEDLPGRVKLPENFQKQVFLPIWKRDDLIRKIWWEKFSLPRLVRRNGCDIFLSLYQCPTIINGSVRHIMVVHDIIPKLFPEYLNNFRKKTYWRLTEKAIKKADKIIAVSRRTEKDLIRHLGVNPAKITVSHIDVDEIYKSEADEFADGKVLKKYGLKRGYILNGGGLEVRKNTEGVMRAYKIVFKKNKKEVFVNDFPQLVIWGKLMPQLAPLVTDAEKLAKEMNLATRVKFLDFVAQEDLPSLYRNAGMFVYPSFYEGFGLPVLEAMSQGVPVIASKCSSLPEVGGDSVLYCDPENIQDIAMVMRNVLANKELREILSRRGKERSKNFSWEKFTEKFFHIIINERRDFYGGKRAY